MNHRSHQIDRPDERQGPLDAAMAAELREILAAAVSVLCDRDRIIVSQRYGLVDGKPATLRQIAAQIGRSVRWVEKREKVIILALRVIASNGEHQNKSEVRRAEAE